MRANVVFTVPISMLEATIWPICERRRPPWWMAITKATVTTAATSTASADAPAPTHRPGPSTGRPVTLVLAQQGGHPRTVQLVPRTGAIPCDQGPMGVITNPVDEHNVPVGAGQALNVALHVPGAMAQGIGGALGQLAAGQTRTGAPPPG